jgi:chemotaxis protein CheX
MKIQLIQPFISAADAVLAEALHGPTSVADMSMDLHGCRNRGIAALIFISGEIEGRIILTMDASTATRIASALAGSDIEESDQVVRETVCELANMVIGNAVTLLNDRGCKFKVHPPEIHADESILRGSADTEALAIYFETPAGRVFLNIAMHYNLRRSGDREPVPAATLP